MRGEDDAHCTTKLSDEDGEKLFVLRLGLGKKKPAGGRG